MPTSDFRNLMLCVLVPLAALLVAWPFAEGGYIDDFSYIHMAKTLAETGRFAYNGWPTAMLGVQVWWGAAWVWLFGFSFTLVRLSVWPLALWAVVLVYLLARRARLSPNDSLFAAFMTGLNPSFIDLAPSFMSDVPGLCLLLASLYAFARAADIAGSHGSEFLRIFCWMAVGMLSGGLGGTIRQTVWLAPLAGSAVVAFWPGARARIRFAALGCAVVTAAGIVVGMRWFNGQPYAIPARPLSAVITNSTVIQGLVRNAFVVAIGSVGVSLPVIVFVAPVMRPWRRAAGRWSVASLAATGLMVLVGALAFLPSATMINLPRSFLPVAAAAAPALWALRILRNGLRLGIVLAIAAAVVRFRVLLFRLIRQAPAAVVVPLVFMVPYAWAMMQASFTTGSLFDRYFLPVVPVMSCVMLWGVGRLTADTSITARWPAAGWTLMILLAAYGGGRLHDRFARCRASLAAVAYLESIGVPRDRIMAGWEVDGWEQIERTGYMNDDRIRLPPDAFQPWKPDGYPENLFMRRKLSALTPEYIVTDDPGAFPRDPPDASPVFPSFPYASWLRPFRREVVISHQRPAR